MCDMAWGGIMWSSEAVSGVMWRCVVLCCGVVMSISINQMAN